MLAAGLGSLVGRGEQAAAAAAATPEALLGTLTGAFAQAQENGVGGHSMATVALAAAFTLVAVAASTPGKDYEGGANGAGGMALAVARGPGGRGTDMQKKQGRRSRHPLSRFEGLCLQGQQASPGCSSRAALRYVAAAHYLLTHMRLVRLVWRCMRMMWL